jgi:hypothetical protein
MYAGLAPMTARSLIVPATARRPMSPPGKKAGLTVCESVAKAMRPPGFSTMAASVSSRSGSLLKTETNSSSISSSVSLPPEPWLRRIES